ncbi:capsule biosynthesis protein [Pseudooceanicola nanhaiensis]|uniref:capsule biosynthesis protein n=1 Tax=Pseudooceanicola nanhaiensis TaxID=375761 RepID=UPI004057EFD3
MTTKPKASKFRVRRATPLSQSGAKPAATPAAEARTPEAPRPAAAAPNPPAPRPEAPAARTPRPEAPRRAASEAEAPGAASAPEAAASAGVVSVVKRRAEDLARRKAAAAGPDAPAPEAAAPTQPPLRLTPEAAAPRAAGPAPRSEPPAEAAAMRPEAAAASLRPAAAEPEQPPREGEVASAREARADLDIDAIRREGLTGRQLRMARRVAQKYGIAATSDFDAVRQLRAQGIDPFERANMLQLVVPQGEGEGPVQLPQTVPVKPTNLPSTELRPADRRAAEIGKLQQDLARRRRKRMMLLFTRLFFFVFAPTFLAGWYFFVVATPMYAAKSEFLILQADNQGGGGLGGLLSGTQFATNQDSIAVQSYLGSKDAMLRLDRDVGFKSHFSQPWIDPIQRLEADPSNEEAYKIYNRNVKIGYDPTEGVIRMEVAAADPAVAAQFSENLIQYAEERVDELSRRKREDGMATAQVSLERAKVERREAQERLVALQEGTFVDPEGIIAGLRQQINSYEVQLNEKELQLAALLDNSRPNSARVEGARADVDRLKTLLAELNAKMTEATSGDSSLAAKAAQIQMAQADLATADLFLQSALQNEKQTELEANRQVRYLTTSVRPVPPEDPSYPRAFENTLLAFLIFAGIYLMISLTASILREQVSA